MRRTFCNKIRIEVPSYLEVTVHTETDTVMEDWGAEFMLKLLRHLPMITAEWPTSSINFLIQVFLFLAQWWTVLEQVRGKEQAEDR